jgi:hypothetical protein
VDSIRIWPTYETELAAVHEYDNPHVDVDVWVDLEAPGFRKRVNGFWDGGRLFRVQMTANRPVQWKHASGSNQDDPGSEGHTGTIAVGEWSEKELAENPCRRRMIIPTGNGHGFMYSDGTPAYVPADTEWAFYTVRYPCFDDAHLRSGSDMAFKDVIRVHRSPLSAASRTIPATHRRLTCDVARGSTAISCQEGLPSGFFCTLRWFEPRTGQWIDDLSTKTVAVNARNRADLPPMPSLGDWGPSPIRTQTGGPDE